MFYGFVYKITNKANGKIYVGQHKGIDFGDYWGSGVALNKAYEKYGREVFDRDVVFYATTKHELDELEKYYIDAFNSMAPNGYNIAEGGHGGYTGVLSAESRKKISDYFKGRPKSKEHREKLSKVKKGVPTHKQTEETKEKLRRLKTGLPAWNKGKGTPVEQLTIEGKYIKTWGSLTEASQKGFNASKISECIHGKRPHHRGFLWRVVENG